MNKKTAIVMLLLILVNLTGVQTSFAKPEYVADLITVYGKGTCETCHVNGTSDGPRTAYGTLFEKPAWPCCQCKCGHESYRGAAGQNSYANGHNAYANGYNDPRRNSDPGSYCNHRSSKDPRVRNSGLLSGIIYFVSPDQKA